jgi:cytidine deaminase
MSKPQHMTRKDALNVLYDMREAFINLIIQSLAGQEHAYDVWKSASDETWEALLKVTEAVYGPAHDQQRSFPCEVCRHRYAEHEVLEKGKIGKTWCCTPCHDCLQSEKELIDLPAMIVCGREKEVQA